MCYTDIHSWTNSQSSAHQGSAAIRPCPTSSAVHVKCTWPSMTQQAHAALQPVQHLTMAKQLRLRSTRLIYMHAYVPCVVVICIALLCYALLCNVTPCSHICHNKRRHQHIGSVCTGTCTPTPTNSLRQTHSQRDTHIEYMKKQQQHFFFVTKTQEGMSTSCTVQPVTGRSLPGRVNCISSRRPQLLYKAAKCFTDRAAWLLRPGSSEEGVDQLEWPSSIAKRVQSC